MEHSDRENIIRKITEIEQQIVHFRKQQEQAEATLRSLRGNLAQCSGESELQNQVRDPATSTADLTLEE